MNRSDESAFSTTRVFVALPLDGASIPRIASIQRHCAAEAAGQGVGLRLTPHHQLHVTLAFLGKIDPSKVQGLLSRVSELVKSVTNFQLHVSGLVAFPSVRRARVIGLALEDPAGLLRGAVTALHTSLIRDGFNLEQRQFRPHVTLARLRHPADAGQVISAVHAADGQLCFDSVGVYQSELGAGGARYRVIDVLQLSHI